MRTGAVLEEQLRVKRELKRVFEGERLKQEVRAVEMEANATPLELEEKIGEENWRFLIGF